MRLEAYVKNKLIRSAEFNLKEPNKALPFQERFDVKQATIRLVIEDFKANYISPLYKDEKVEIVAIMESRMNQEPVEVKSAVVEKVAQVVQKKVYDIPRMHIPEKEPVKFTRPKAVYSNSRGYDY